MRVVPSRRMQYINFVRQARRTATERQLHCMDVAHGWADLMEAKITGNTPFDEAARVSLCEINPDNDGQLWLVEYRTIVEFLTMFWLWGHGLREWHNHRFCSVATAARFSHAGCVFPIEQGMNRATGGTFSRVESLNAFLTQLGNGKVA
jgi:hypothetical protein